MSDPGIPTDHAIDLYIELMKRCLTRELFTDSSRVFVPRTSLQQRLQSLPFLKGRRSRDAGFDPRLRAEGRDWPTEAETMIGRARLDNLDRCARDVVRRGVPGDLIETGVWRGGATI